MLKPTQRVILRIIGMAIFNFAGILTHIQVFQSAIPYLAWGTIILHVVMLAIIPWKKFFNLS